MFLGYDVAVCDFCVSLYWGIYAKDGGYNRESNAGGYTFELAHTHPILCLDEDGHLSKVVQSETKRGVSALPFEIYEPYMNAYKRWVALLEEDRFKCKFDWPEHSMVVMNNHRVLHGRAEVPPGVKRSMVFGYVMKTVYENRYRLLKQRQAEHKSPKMNHKWLTRLPNQVLTSLVNWNHDIPLQNGGCEIVTCFFFPDPKYASLSLFEVFPRVSPVPVDTTTDQQDIVCVRLCLTFDSSWRGCCSKFYFCGNMAMYLNVLIPPEEEVVAVECTVPANTHEISWGDQGEQAWTGAKSLSVFSIIFQGELRRWHGIIKGFKF